MSKTPDGSGTEPESTPSSADPNTPYPSGQDSFASEQEALTKWPDTYYAVEDSLDADLIEGRGKQLLFQSLNNRSTVAFVGSGFSLAYGRLSWDDWLARQIETTVENGQAIRALLVKLIDCLRQAHDLKREHSNQFRLDEIHRRFINIKRPDFEYRLAELDRVTRTFDAMRLTNAFSGGSIIPITFQMAEQLHEIHLKLLRLILPGTLKRKPGGKKKWDLDLFNEHLHHHVFEKLSESHSHIFDGVEVAGKSLLKRINKDRFLDDFALQAKKLLIDECAHAESILTNGLASGTRNGRRGKGSKFLKHLLQIDASENLRRDIMGIRQMPDRYWALGAFKLSKVRKFCEQLEKHINPDEDIPLNKWALVLAAVKELTTSPRETAAGSKAVPKRAFLSPTHRFVFEMMAALPEKPDSLIDDAYPNGFKVTSNDFQSRNSLFDPQLDPASKLSGSLGISKFLTLNYDFEIERYFQDRGYRHFAVDSDLSGDRRERLSPDDYRTDSIGGILRDQAFRREHSTELLEFSIDEDFSDARVFHLHGHADRSGPIVANERDYMELYLRNDRHRNVVDESLSVVFSANPLLFVGLGLSEADVMRPLRQFMSDQSAISTRTVIALMPAFKDVQTRARDSAGLFVRYGVHSIFFGSGTVKVNSRATGKVTTWHHPVDWLHRIIELVKVLQNINKEQLEILQALAAVEKKPVSGGDEESIRKQRELLEGLTDASREANPFHSANTPGALFERIKRAVGHRRDKLDFEDQSKQSREQKFDVLSLLLGVADANGAGIALDDFLKSDSILGPCRFRIPRADARPAQSEIEVDADAARFEPILKFERTLLTALLKITLNHDGYKKLTGLLPSLCANAIKGETFEKAKQHELYAHIRDLRARQIALKGLGDAIMTGTFCTALDLVEEEWRSWWNRWKLTPPERRPVLDMLPNTKKFGLPVRFVRHHVDSVITPLDHCSATGLPDSGIRAFDQFIKALRGRHQNASDLEIKVTEHVRRLHLVLAPRGFGKGVFLSTLVTRHGTDAYINAVAGDAKFTDPYLASVALNLSFSSEIASTFDMLVNALIDCVVVLAASAKASKSLKVLRRELSGLADESIDFDLREDLRAEYGPLPRLEQIGRLLQAFNHLSKVRAISGKPIRIIITISAIELFYYEPGLSKNREIQELIDLLTSDETADIPFDLILIGDGDKVGPPFRFGTEFEKRLEKVKHLAETGEADFLTKYTETHSRLVFLPVARDSVRLESLSHLARRQDNSGIDYAYRFEPISQLLKSPPSDTMQKPHWRLVAPPHSQTKLPSNPSLCSVFFARVLKPEELLVDDFTPLAAILYAKHIIEPNLKRRFSPSIDNMDMSHLALDSGKMDKIWDTDGPYEVIFTKLKNEASRRSSDVKTFVETLLTSIEHARANGDAQFITDDLALLADKGLEAVLKERYRTRDDVSFREWRAIRQVLGENRFSLTIVLAAAQRLALLENLVIKGAEAAESFIRKTVDAINAVGEAGRGKVVVQSVLSAYHVMHIQGKPRYDRNLHLLLLRHLAVIGTPTSSDVLVRVPEIRLYFDDLPDKKNMNCSRRLQVAEALTELCSRGLVFKIKPQPVLERSWADKDEQWLRRHFGIETPDAEPRYALHRLVQHYVIEKMGAGPREFMQLNSFAPSLYASMAADLPRLNPDAYRFLRVLVASLSQYPDQRRGDAAVENLHFSQAPFATRVQAVRAALSVVRSTFSVAAVSRFVDYASEPRSGGRPPRGYFELYRIQIRWLIRISVNLLDRSHITNRTERENLVGYKAEGPHKQLVSFYRDEIAWLYNECGLICLVQGSLYNASALLRQSLRVVRKIEGPGGAHENRISMNLAIVQIERGNLSAAEERLKTICESEKNHAGYRGRIWHLAFGYLGLIEHIRGSAQQAEHHYRTAIAGLQAFSDTRALSIFNRHLGDLERGRGNDLAAESYLRESETQADAGGHEDLTSKTKLAALKLTLSKRGRATSDHVKHSLEVVETALAYARIMEMPALTCEALTVKGSILLDQGETVQSGKCLAEAIALAKRNGMRLRQNNAVITYCRVLGAKGEHEQANRLAATAMAMAKRQSNQLEIRRATAMAERRYTERGG